ncbi:MAG: ferredoxin--NADP reductase [Chitinophagaceae bacterium]|nr:ferredoxin--NADP reductase [Chitinophagaceae bacterium]
MNLFTKNKSTNTLKIKEIHSLTKDTIAIIFEDIHKLTYKPGQYITFLLEKRGKKYKRAYSLSSSPFLKEFPSVAIKKIPNGVMTEFIHKTLRAGDTLQIIPPLGNFTVTCSPKNKRHLLFFAGGSGITPLFSMVKSIIHQEPQSKILLVYANRDFESIIFRKELEHIQNTNPQRLQIIHILEQPFENYETYKGFITHDIIKSLVQEVSDTVPLAKEYYTCGPAPMMDIIIESLQTLGIPKNTIHKEVFVSFPDDESNDNIAPTNSKSSKVTILLQGQEFFIDVPHNKTILEVGLSHNIDMPYSCQSGICTACRGKLITGKVQMKEIDSLSDEERQNNYILCCVSQPRTQDITIAIE